MTCDPIATGDPRGNCRRLCCSDADCRAPRKCVVMDRKFGSLGLCK
jgi:hypothetical protein